MTDRALTPTFAAALSFLRPIIFYEGVFTGGTLRLHSRLHSIDWNGQTWTGAGILLSISKIMETTELRAVGFTVSLSGMNAGVLQAALAQSRMGQPGRVWMG